MKKIVFFTASLVLSMVCLFPEGEAVSFDEIDEAEEVEAPAPLIRAGGLNFNLYTDFTLYGGLNETINAGEKEWEPFLEFGQNHFNVMGMVSNDQFSAVFDISTASRFLEFTLDRENTAVTLGRIFIPFGSADYHHIYGGHPDEGSLFLPFFWTDYGVKVNQIINDSLNFDFGITNGFRTYAGAPVFTSSPTDENNLMKALNLRVNFSPALNTTGSFSLMFDSFSDDDAYLWEDSILMYGVDLSQRLGALTLKGGAALGEVRIHSEGLDESLLLPLTYYRIGWYAEASYRFDAFTLRLRTGGVDPDSRQLDQDDALNFNTGIIVPFGPMEWQTVYLINYPLGGAVSGTSTGLYHQVLTKFLIRL